MGEKLKFRPMAGELLLLAEGDLQAEVAATGSDCVAQIGDRVTYKEHVAVVKERVVKVDGVSYHMQRDADVQVIKNEEDS